MHEKQNFLDSKETKAHHTKLDTKFARDSGAAQPAVPQSAASSLIMSRWSQNSSGESREEAREKRRRRLAKAEEKAAAARRAVEADEEEEKERKRKRDKEMWTGRTTMCLAMGGFQW